MNSNQNPHDQFARDLEKWLSEMSDMFSNESIVNMMVEMDKIEEAYQNRPETQKRNEEIWMDILIAVIFLTVVIYVTINICRGVKRLLVGKFPKGEKGSASAVAEVEYTPQPPKTTPHMEEDWKKKGREYMASWQK